MSEKKPLSNIDFGLRGAALGYTAGATLPIAALLAKLIKDSSYRKKFKKNWGEELGKAGALSATAGTIGAIPTGYIGYKLGKFINNSRQQQDEMYKNRLMAEALLQQQPR